MEWLVAFGLWANTKRGKLIIHTTMTVITVGLSLWWVDGVKRDAYRAGVEATEAKYRESGRTLSNALGDALAQGFEQHQRSIEQMQEIQYEKLEAILADYARLGRCHNDDGIGLLNEQIRSRK